MFDIEDVCGAEWAEWYRKSPPQRWAESEKLWSTYLALGGALDPEPDPQSPFFDAEEWRPLRSDEVVSIIGPGNLRPTASRDAASGRWEYSDMRVDSTTLEDIREALKAYEAEVEASNLAEKTKVTYLRHVETFVRWLAGDFQPGVRRPGL